MVSEAIRLQPDVIVVDVGMPLLNGLDAAWKIRKQAPNIKFIIEPGSPWVNGYYESSTGSCGMSA